MFKRLKTTVIKALLMSIIVAKSMQVNAVTLVDFGSTAAQNQFLAGWSIASATPGITYTSDGPGGIIVKNPGPGEFQDFFKLIGPSLQLSHGQRLVITIYNNSTTTKLSISDYGTPMVSFTDQDGPSKESGQPQWYGFTSYPSLEEFHPITSGQISYSITKDDKVFNNGNILRKTEGIYTALSFSWNRQNYGTINTMVIDKIEIMEADIQKPTVPANLRLVSKGSGYVDLAWDASSDNDVVRDYYIYQNGKEVAGTTQTQYRVFYLTPETQYNFQVVACDNAENISDKSANLSVITNPPANTNLLNPYSNIQYKGAFRFPVQTWSIPKQENYSWALREYYGGLTFYPKGDPTKLDGDTENPGSLIVYGHKGSRDANDVYHGPEVAEISIPKPVISTTMNVDDLPRAKTIQNLNNIYKNQRSIGQPCDQVEYLPKQGAQTTDKLYYIQWNMYYQNPKNFYPTYGAAELNLSSPNPTGEWWVGPKNPLPGDETVPQYPDLSGYIFEIPSSWAQANTDGYLLATGAGIYSPKSNGATLYSIAPWKDGNPLPAENSELSYKTMLKYTYAHPAPMLTRGDAILDGAWITFGNNKSAVGFSGAKGLGHSYYGFVDGTLWKDVRANVPMISPKEDKANMASRFAPLMFFYNPDDFAKVLNGQMNSWEPTPYATFDFTPYLYSDKYLKLPESDYRRMMGQMAFDRENSLLYVIENEAYSDGFTRYDIIHVFKIGNAMTMQKLNVTKTGDGNGNISSVPGGINLGDDGEQDYVENTIVTLTATPDANSDFIEWSGHDNAKGNECTVRMNEAKNVVAKFKSKTGNINKMMKITNTIVFPNPVNANTGSIQIRYTITSGTTMTCKIFSPIGQLIHQEQLTHSMAGTYDINWDWRSINGQVIPSGIYLVQLSDKNNTVRKTIKLVIL